MLLTLTGDIDNVIVTKNNNMIMIIKRSKKNLLKL